MFSAGSEPADEVNPAAVDAMAEIGINIPGQVPRRWTIEMVDEVDVVVTMGCGDACPFVPGTRYIEWDLTDPAGLPPDEVRRVRDGIRNRIESLIVELTSTPGPSGPEAGG